jgi:hypothetical protein
VISQGIGSFDNRTAASVWSKGEDYEKDVVLTHHMEPTTKWRKDKCTNQDAVPWLHYGTDIDTRLGHK